MNDLIQMAAVLMSEPLGQWWVIFSILSILFLLGWRLWVWHAYLRSALAFRNAPIQANWSGLGVLKNVWPQKLTVKSKVNAQLPLFLRTLGSTLKAGYSVPQALAFTAQETENPLQAKLKTGLELLRIEQPLEVVLNEWKRDLKVAEFSFLSDSLTVQSRRGGNLVSVCYSVASLLEDRQKLERDLRSFTAQGKLSGLLMALLWPVSLGLFAWLSPSHTEILFNTSAGRVLLGLSLFLEFIGFLLIWRLVRLKI